MLRCYESVWDSKRNVYWNPKVALYDQLLTYHIDLGRRSGGYLHMSTIGRAYHNSMRAFRNSIWQILVSDDKVTSWGLAIHWCNSPPLHFSSMFKFLSWRCMISNHEIQNTESPWGRSLWWDASAYSLLAVSSPVIILADDP